MGGKNHFHKKKCLQHCEQLNSSSSSSSRSNNNSSSMYTVCHLLNGVLYGFIHLLHMTSLHESYHCPNMSMTSLLCQQTYFWCNYINHLKRGSRIGSHVWWATDQTSPSLIITMRIPVCPINQNYCKWLSALQTFTLSVVPREIQCNTVCDGQRWPFEIQVLISFANWAEQEETNSYMKLRVFFCFWVVILYHLHCNYFTFSSQFLIQTIAIQVCFCRQWEIRNNKLT